MPNARLCFPFVIDSTIVLECYPTVACPSRATNRKEGCDEWVDVISVDPDAIELALPPDVNDAAQGLDLLEFQVMILQRYWKLSGALWQRSMCESFFASADVHASTRGDLRIIGGSVSFCG